MRVTLFLIGALIGAGANAAPKAEVPPEIQSHVPVDLRSYYVAFLVNVAEPKPMSQDVFERHQAYIREQQSKAVYQLGGPLTDGGRIRGMIILTAASLDNAREIVGGDPAVKAGVFGVEVHPAVFPNLDSLKVEYAPRP